jgi:hypothetical protein
MMALLNLAVAMLPPAPPEPQRTTPLPVYSAKCRLVDRNTKDHRLAFAIRGFGEGRRAVFKKGSGPLKALVALDQKASVISFGNSQQLWDTGDVVKARLGNRDVTVWIDVKANVSRGATVKITDAAEMFGLPLFAGLCRTEAFEGATQ